MENIFKWPLWHWHIEVSSKCTLKCPLCPRTELKESLVQDELSLQFFKDTFTGTILEEVQVVSFCGDDGDPIYAKEFLQIVQYLKEAKPSINILIVTNGSYRSEDWWAELGQLLNENDEIHWSIDGHDNKSNNVYRVNSSYYSIMAGIKACKTTAVKTWAAIYFKFNENKTDELIAQAAALGMDKIQFTKSTKFGHFYPHLSGELNNTLEPDNKNLISTTGRFTRDTINLTTKAVDFSTRRAINIAHYKQTISRYNDSSIIPLCMIGNKGMYINSQGYFIPCCWLGNRYSSDYSMFITDDNNINVHGIEAVINRPEWQQFLDSFTSRQQCNEKCKAAQVTEDYATSW